VVITGSNPKDFKSTLVQWDSHKFQGEKTKDFNFIMAQMED